MMGFLKNLILIYFKNICKLILKIKKPLVICITGSAGKTTTKEIIWFVLSQKFGKKNVFKNFESLNNEFGIPLTIFLAEFRPGNNIFLWLKVIFMSLVAFLRKYPKILVLELGVEKPGDMQFFMEFIKPYIGIITTIGEFPAHSQFFEKKEDVAKEKGFLIENLPENGFAILNSDDILISENAKRTKAKIIWFGKNKENDITILGNGRFIFFGKEIEIKIEPYSSFGINFDLPLSCLLGVARAFDLKIEDIEKVKEYSPLAGRMRILKKKFKKEVIIFDDTYNASPVSYFYLFEIAKNLKGRKIGIFADVLEADNFAKEIHEKLIEKINEIFDFVILIGPRFNTFSKNLKIDNLRFEFPKWEEISKIIPEKDFDFLFIKGARAFHLEKILKIWNLEALECFCSYKKPTHEISFRKTS